MKNKLSCLLFVIIYVKIILPKLKKVLAFHSLIRNFELRSKLLPLEKTQINLVFYSLNRNFELRSKVLTFGKAQKNFGFSLTYS